MLPHSGLLEDLQVKAALPHIHLASTTAEHPTKAAEETALQNPLAASCKVLAIFEAGITATAHAQLTRYGAEYGVDVEVVIV